MTSIVNDPPYERASSHGNKQPIPEEFICKLCNKQQVDPRVLSCFHSFCLACLQETLDRQIIAKSTDTQELCSASSAGSGYESDIMRDNNSWQLQCPECFLTSKLPIGGINALPPHYILQHRMLLASLNQDSISFFCDLCSSDIPAVTRCTFCLLNLCVFCSDTHKRQRVSSGHEMVNLTEPKIGVTAIRRQLMCMIHPDKELSLYCSHCGQVVCRDCCILLHRGHTCEVAVRAAPIHSNRVRERIHSGKFVLKEAKLSLDKLNVISQRVQTRCDDVEQDIKKFIESYIQSIREHEQQLLAVVSEARSTKMDVISFHQKEIMSNITGADQALRFADQLIDEGSDIEILSFAPMIVSKLDACLKAPDYLPDLKVLETLNFLPDEKAGLVSNKQMFGVVTTQRVSAAHSHLEPEGLETLNNARQQQSCEVILITKDCDGQPMCHGGERVTAEARYRDLSLRSLPVSVIDRQDGSYVICFTPDSAGNVALAVTIGGAVVKGSPFPVCVRTLRAHHGTFHCCSFCSSGGRKDACCGCGAVMPGGFKGCGHGHVGHPGRRHWSCCGNTLHNSECGRPPPTLYHFSM